MKVIAGILFLCVVVLTAEAGRNCPQCNRPCTLEFDPVCSTQGCDYGNPCVMQCAGGQLLHRGPCRRNSYGK